MLSRRLAGLVGKAYDLGATSAFWAVQEGLHFVAWVEWQTLKRT